MLDLKNPKVAIPIVLIAGVFWSFGPYVVRHIDQPETVPWQYLFTRGLVIFLLLNMYLFLEEGKNFYKNYLKVKKLYEKYSKICKTLCKENNKIFTNLESVSCQ